MNHYQNNKIFASALVISLIAISISAVVEYGYLIKPCKLCQWQRWGFISISTISLLGIFSKNKKWFLWGVFSLFVCLFSLSTYHVLIQYGFLKDPCIVPKIKSNEFWEMINTPLPCSKISFALFGMSPSLYNSVFSLCFSGYILLSAGIPKKFYR